MNIDLFKQTKSKKEQLKEWILSRNFTKTSDVIKWGIQNFHTRADRDARDLAEEGLIRRMNDAESKAYFPGVNEGIYVKPDFKALGL